MTNNNTCCRCRNCGRCCCVPVRDNMGLFAGDDGRLLYVDRDRWREIQEAKRQKMELAIAEGLVKR